MDALHEAFGLDRVARFQRVQIEQREQIVGMDEAVGRDDPVEDRQAGGFLRQHQAVLAVAEVGLHLLQPEQRSHEHEHLARLDGIDEVRVDTTLDFGPTLLSDAQRDLQDERIRALLLDAMAERGAFTEIGDIMIEDHQWRCLGGDMA